MIPRRTANTSTNTAWQKSGTFSLIIMCFQAANTNPLLECSGSPWNLSELWRYTEKNVCGCDLKLPFFCILKHCHYSSLCNEGHSTVGSRPAFLWAYCYSSLRNESHFTVNLKSISPQGLRPRLSDHDSHPTVNPRPMFLWTHRSNPLRRNVTPTPNPRPAVVLGTLDTHHNDDPFLWSPFSVRYNGYNRLHATHFLIPSLIPSLIAMIIMSLALRSSYFFSPLNPQIRDSKHPHLLFLPTTRSHAFSFQSCVATTNFWLIIRLKSKQHASRTF